MSDDEAPPAPAWEGAFDEDGKPNGKGTMKYPPPAMGEDDEDEKPGDVFEGTMQHGVREGLGTYTWSNGAVYVGSYVGNKKHGKGKMTFPDKGVYEGDFQDDLLQGSGTYTYAGGDVYQGQFLAGRRHGKGMYHYKAPGCQLVGDWADGQFAYGRWVFKDGSMFMGSFAAGPQQQPAAGGGCATSQPAQGAYYYASSSLVQEGSFQAGAWVAAGELRVGKEFSVA